MNKAISRRILAFVLAIATVIAFTPAIAFTQSAHAATGDIIVGNVTLNSTGTAVYALTDNAGAVTTDGADASNYNIMWDGSTLTLNGAAINGVAKNNGAGIYYAGTTPITIDVEGTNTVEGADSSDNAYGLYTKGDLTFKGSGSLGVTGGTAGANSYGIRSYGSMTVSGGTITATGGAAEAAHESDGISCGESMTVNGGTVTGNGDDTGSSKVTYGIFCGSGSLTVSGGSVTGNGGKGSSSSYGISANGINESGGAIKGTSGGAAVNYGIMSAGYIKVDGGAFEGTAAAATGSYGIIYWKGQTFNINGGRVTGKGETCAVGYFDNGEKSGAPVLGTGIYAVTNTASDKTGTSGTYKNGDSLSGVEYFLADAGSSVIVGDKTMSVNCTKPVEYATTTTSGSVSDPVDTEPQGGYNVKLSYDSNDLPVLTFKDATINGVADSNYGAGIYYAGTTAITIDVEGTNTVRGAGSSNNAYGLYTKGDLTFKGSGSLGVTGGTLTMESSYGIYSGGSMTVSGGTITATGVAKMKGTSYGIYSNESMTVNGGTVTGNGDNTGSSSITFGIFCRSGSLTVDGGSVTGNGGKGSNQSYGIGANGINESGGAIKGTSEGTVLNGGIMSDGDIKVDGGAFEGTAAAATRSYGIIYVTNKTFYINGGRVTGKGETCAVERSNNGPVLGAGVTAYTATDTAGTTGITQYTNGSTLSDNAKFFGSPYTAPAPVAYPPTVTTQPTGGSYDIGGTVTPLKVATSDSGATYQWQKSADGATWTNIDGATNPTYTPSAGASGSTKYRCLITGSNGASTYSDAVTITVSSRYAVGAKFTNGLLTFKVNKQPAAKTTSASKNGTVQVVKPVKKTYKSITVPTSVKMNGYTYNVTTIGKKAFYKNSKLKTVTIKSTKITSIGSKAFKGCKKAMTIKVPKSKYKAYKKLLKGKVPAGTKIRKI